MKNKLRFRIPIKARFILASIIQFGGAFLFAWFFNRVIEMFIIVPLFFIFRSKYEKTFHAKSINQCTAYTLIMLAILCIVNQPVHISIFLSIILCYLTTEILYFIKDYIDLRELNNKTNFKDNKIQFCFGMDENILLKECENHNLNEIETKVMIMYYCKRMKRWQIGNALNYSEETIGRIKRKALEKFKED